MPCPWVHRQVCVPCVTQLSCRANSSAWEHREDPCLEGIFSGAIFKVQDRDMIWYIGTNLHLGTVPS